MNTLIKCEVTTGEAPDEDIKGGKMIMWIVDNVYCVSRVKSAMDAITNAHPIVCICPVLYLLTLTLTYFMPKMWFDWSLAVILRT